MMVCGGVVHVNQKKKKWKKGDAEAHDESPIM